jgi:hypothetical protein
MTTLTSSQSLVNPLLRDFDRVSPAQVLDLIIGYDDEGWATFQTFAVGNIVVSLSGNLFKVIGFSLDNEVLVMPYGLGHDRAIRSMSFQAAGLRVTDPPICESFAGRG